MTYTVEVTREGDAWIADVVNLPGAHTYAKNIPALRDAVVEVIRLVADLGEDEALDVSYDYRGVEPLAFETAKLGTRRVSVEQEQKALLTESAVKVAQMTEAGYSVRDIAGLLRMTPGRVSQIMATARVSRDSHAS